MSKFSIKIYQWGLRSRSPATRRVYAHMFFVSHWHRATETLCTKATQNRMAQRHHRRSFATGGLYSAATSGATAPRSCFPHLYCGVAHPEATTFPLRYKIASSEASCQVTSEATIGDSYTLWQRPLPSSTTDIHA